jgi:Fe-S cluster assembly protein SufD
MVQTIQKPAPKGADAHVEMFRRFEAEPRQPEWLFPLRKAGIARFAELGFPTLQHEDWRFTNVAPIAKLPFKPVFEPAADGITAETLQSFAFSKLPGCRLVFINGHYAAELSTVRGLPAGVKVSNLAGALAAEPGLLEKHLGRYAQTEDAAFTALNQAFFLDGGFVHVPAGKVVRDPIQFVYISTTKHGGATVQPRNLIIAESDSQATFIESYVTVGGTAYFTNAVTEMVAGDNATIEYLKFQDEALDAFQIGRAHV